MEVFHYVTEKLRVYPLFENGNKSIKINKERGAVYNDFCFDSTKPDSPIKQKCKRRCVPLLCAKECSEEELPESYERKLDTIENGTNN